MKSINENAFSGLEAAIVLIAFVVIAAAFSFAILNTGFFATQEATSAIHTGIGEATSALQLGGDVVATATQYITLDNGVVKSFPGQVHGSWNVEINDRIINLTNIYGVKEGTILLWDKTNSTGLARPNWIALLNNRWAFDNHGTKPIIGETLDGAIVIGRGQSEIFGNQYIRISNIAPGKSIAHITVPLTLAAGGRPIDLNRNRTVITYTDDTIHIPNVYTKPRGTLIEAASLEWIARHDNDNILEFGELAIFTIPIDGAPTNADLRANEQFTITIQPPQGAALAIKRTIPPNINPKSILRT